jgi:tRNA(His) 5'-end guanylyltransferase
MKYIITEGKLDSVIDSFITNQFGNLEHQMDGNKLTLTNDNGDPLIVILDYDNLYEVFVLDTVCTSINNLFSLNGFDDIQHHLRKWLKKHLNINIDEIQTFSNEEVVYIY